MQNVLDIEYRKSIIDEINGEENKARKNESLRRSEVYNGRLRRFVNEKLLLDFSPQTVSEMRTVTSINLTKRLIDNKSSVYKREPNRNFYRESKVALTENESQQLDELYEYSCANVSLKKANRTFNLQRQCAVQLVPKGGKIVSRILQPHHYDVIPKDDDPTQAFAYIVSVYDKSLLFNQSYVNQQSGGSSLNYLSQQESDTINQMIGDSDDSKTKERYIWWTAEYNFITDGNGFIINEFGQSIQFNTVEDVQMIKNPIMKLPFIDVSADKDFEFWSRQGDNTVQFNIDFLVMMSDISELMKRQGYSQAIFYSEKPPVNMLIGPNRVLHIPLDPNKETQPRFEWSTPQPDLASAIRIIENFTNFFMTSEGLDPKLVSGSGEAQKFSSGIDRFLAMIQQAEAGQDDYALFNYVEYQYLELIKAWSNIMQGATIKAGVDPLIPELQQAMLPEDLAVDVEFAGPEMIETKKDKEDSVLRRLEQGMISRKRAIMELDGADEATAEATIKEIDDELRMPADANTKGQIQGEPG